MKTLATGVVLLMLLLVGSTIAYRAATFNPTLERQRQIEAFQRQQRRANAINLALTILTVGGAVVVVGGAIGFGGLVAYRLHARARDERLRARDGMFPLVEVKQHGITHMIDPNSLASWGVSVNGSVQEMEPAAGWERQFTVTEQANKVRLLSASGMSNRYGSGRRMNVAETRLLSGEADARAERERYRAEDARLRLEQRQFAMPPEPEPVEINELTLTEAWGRAEPDKWLLGQSMETGKLATFNPHTTVHMAILGATGSGKTESSGLLAMMYARYYGMHTIILDGKGGLDWGRWRHVCEWHEMTHQTLQQQAQQIVSIHNERMGILKQYGVANIHDLNSSEIQPMFVILEEFGNAYAMLKEQSRGAARKVNIALDTLLRLARATGISLCFIDQAPQNWTQQMRGNTKFKLAYKLGGQMGNMIGEYHLHDLPDVGWFSLDNHPYRSWHTAAEIDGKTVNLPRSQYTVLEPAEPVQIEGGGIDRNHALPLPHEKTVLEHVHSEKYGFASGSEPVLYGPVETVKERELVRRIVSETGSKTAAVKTLWGSKNGKTWKWLNEALEGES